MNEIKALDSAGSWLELNDDLITAADLTAEIERRLSERPPESAPHFPEYALESEPPDFPAGIPYRFGQYYHLQRANALYNQAETNPVLAPSPATQIPLIGRLWRQIRAGAHDLVLFYVNRHISHQTGVNRHLVQTLNELTRQVEEQQHTIERLQAQLTGRKNPEEQPQQDD